MTKVFKMTNGAAHHDWFSQHRRRDQVYVQKKHDIWNHWSWRSCSEYDHKMPECSRDQSIIYAVLSLPDSMERGLFKRGITRREYKVCLLEARYPCQNRSNVAKPTKSAKRKYKNGRCFQTGPFRRDKQASDESHTVDTIESRTKRLCIRDRPVVNVTLRDKVFQGVGNDLIAPWLTPTDLYNFKQAVTCDWEWDRTWHGGKVKDKTVAAQVVVHLSRGTPIDTIINMFDKDRVFSALWYILPCHMFVPHAHRLKHWKSIRKLDRLRY